MKIKTQKIEEVLSRGVEKVIKKENLLKKLKSGKKLRIKHGIDPTTKDLHLGHSVVYLKLKELQGLGHKIVFLIGDFTGRFGDPTEKLKTRTLRPKKEVRNLAKNYLRQAGKILDFKKIEIRYNSEWYDKMSAQELLQLMSYFTSARMLERDMFQERIKKGLEIQFHEPVYPVLQAYDSVMLKSDLTVCGIDQIFNELKAKELQEKLGQPGQDIIATKILVGLDGKEKMSQSLGNYIGIEEKAQEQYGKIMSIPDNLIFNYFELLTNISLPKLKEFKQSKINPRDLKVRLAREIVTMYHSKKAAQEAEKEFKRIFKEKKLPTKIPEIKVNRKKINILDLLVKTKLVSSKTDAKRLILQKGIKINSKVQKDWKAIIETKKGLIVQVGKRKFVKLV
ncbi:tyrosine--tRNA ligase [Patescibacteria group bacterium]|nr:tyrosine--tRNA ligase [Patescibacteria group bacterium]